MGTGLEGNKLEKIESKVLSAKKVEQLFKLMEKFQISVLKMGGIEIVKQKFQENTTPYTVPKDKPTSAKIVPVNEQVVEVTKLFSEM